MQELDVGLDTSGRENATPVLGTEALHAQADDNAHLARIAQLAIDFASVVAACVVELLGSVHGLDPRVLLPMHTQHRESHVTVHGFEVPWIGRRVSRVRALRSDTLLEVVDPLLTFVPGPNDQYNECVNPALGTAAAQATAATTAADNENAGIQCDAYNRASGAALSRGFLSSRSKYTYNLRVYVERYNVLVLSNGMGGLQYAF